MHSYFKYYTIFASDLYGIYEIWNFPSPPHMFLIGFRSNSENSPGEKGVYAGESDLITVLKVREVR